ncbi:MAG: STAS domain-containing protein [Meiothermus ruber]|mgnify:CR=1 FL=1|nr:STAS domain-containing protein [Meiothermus sp.]MCX8087763.1 STAS domain-containing protein [Meiothermus ruber]
MIHYEMISETAARFAIEGRLDVQQAPVLRQSLGEARDRGAKDLRLDMSGVDFMDSAGLAALVSGLKQVKNNGGSLVIENPSPAVRKVLELTLLDKVIPIEEGA